MGFTGMSIVDIDFTTLDREPGDRFTSSLTKMSLYNVTASSIICKIFINSAQLYDTVIRYSYIVQIYGTIIMCSSITQLNGTVILHSYITQLYGTVICRSVTT